jgi:xanthine dehydrogenase accessory factor
MTAAAPISPFILIRGAGEMASAIAWRLFMANMTRICMLELPDPLCVRREVSFCTAFDRGGMSVEGVRAVVAANGEEMEAAWKEGAIAVMQVADWENAAAPAPDVVVDAILAKKNVATSLADAPLVIALGPGFAAGKDCHVVIETNRGHDLGRIILNGEAAPNTGVPGNIGGHTATRVLRAPASGIFETEREIGNHIAAGETVGTVAGKSVTAGLDGMLRGLIRPGTEVASGLKLGDIDPRGAREFCYTISDKARALSGSVLESVMRFHNGNAPTARQ